MTSIQHWHIYGRRRCTVCGEPESTKQEDARDNIIEAAERWRGSIGANDEDNALDALMDAVDAHEKLKGM